jgi:hypothetical protein
MAGESRSGSLNLISLYRLKYCLRLTRANFANLRAILKAWPRSGTMMAMTVEVVGTCEAMVRSGAAIANL